MAAASFSEGATESDQSAADADQTAADGDQTAADSDQSAADRDRISASDDQLASDRDQIAADEDFDDVSQPSVARRRIHEQRTVERAKTTLGRRASAGERAGAAGERDTNAQTRYEVAAGRDLAAEERDRESERRDREAEALARQLAESDPLSVPMAADLALVARAAATTRAQAAEDRRRAAEDRRRAAEDREQATRDREALQAELERAHLDPLTGAYGRAMGEVVLRHELERARRSGTGLVLAFADIDGLKALNDSKGHAAGDSLLCDAVAAIRAKLRPYDPVARWGGDEFVCTFPGEGVDGSHRLTEVQQVLRETQPNASITIGVASLRESDSFETLLDRANGALRDARHGSQSSHATYR